MTSQACKIFLGLTLGAILGKVGRKIRESIICAGSELAANSDDGLVSCCAQNAIGAGVGFLKQAVPVDIHDEVANFQTSKISRPALHDGMNSDVYGDA